MGRLRKGRVTDNMDAMKHLSRSPVYALLASLLFYASSVYAAAFKAAAPACRDKAVLVKGIQELSPHGQKKGAALKAGPLRADA